MRRAFSDNMDDWDGDDYEAYAAMSEPRSWDEMTADEREEFLESRGVITEAELDDLDEEDLDDVLDNADLIDDVDLDDIPNEEFDEDDVDFFDDDEEGLDD